MKIGEYMIQEEIRAEKRKGLWKKGERETDASKLVLNDIEWILCYCICKS